MQRLLQCTACGGTGRVSELRDNGNQQWYEDVGDCSVCDGDGAMSPERLAWVTAKNQIIPHWKPGASQAMGCVFGIVFLSVFVSGCVFAFTAETWQSFWLRLLGTLITIGLTVLFTWLPGYLWTRHHPEPARISREAFRSALSTATRGPLRDASSQETLANACPMCEGRGGTCLTGRMELTQFEYVIEECHECGGTGIIDARLKEEYGRLLQRQGGRNDAYKVWRTSYVEWRSRLSKELELRSGHPVFEATIVALENNRLFFVWSGLAVTIAAGLLSYHFGWAPLFVVIGLVVITIILSFGLRLINGIHAA